MSELLKRSKAQIGKRNRRAGKKFESDVAKMIARHFGWNWKNSFDRAGSGHQQSHDAVTLSKFQDDWPFWWECKNRQNWNFHQFFKDPEKATPYLWYKEAKENTPIDNLNGALAFTKPYCPIYWMVNSQEIVEPKASKFLDYPYSVFSFLVRDDLFTIMLLEDFLKVWK